MTTIGTLFTGFGGVDIGAMAAGLKPLWGVEYRSDVAAVANHNLGNHVMVADVRSVDYARLPHVDVLHASPVCTRASRANPNATESDEDITIADAVVKAIDAQQPEIFTLENVWAYRNFNSYLNILDALGRNGYMYDFEHVNAADFGVPQTRQRLILRAVRGLLPPLPLPVAWVGWYAAIADLIDTLPESKLAPWQLARLPAEFGGSVLVDVQNTIRDATVLSVDAPSNSVSSQGASRPSHRLAILFGSNGNSESWGDHHVADGAPMLTVSGQTLGRSRAVLVAGDSNANSWGDNYRCGETPAFTAKENAVGRSKAVLVDGDSWNVKDGTPTLRDANEPAMTLRSGRIPPHRATLQNGRVVAMTPRALARFQTFPDWYELPDKRSLAAYGIGNAVPPLLYQRIVEGLAA